MSQRRWFAVSGFVLLMPLLEAAAQCPEAARELYRQGRQLFLEQRYEAAEPVLRQAVEQCPAEAMTRTYLGLALGHQAQKADVQRRRELLDEAKLIFDEAIQIQQDNPRINQAYATLLLIGANHAEAELKFSRAIEILQRQLESASEAQQSTLRELLAQAQQGRDYASAQKTEMANDLGDDELLQRFLPSKANEVPKIPFKIEFAFGQAQLRPESRQLLDRVARVLQRPVFESVVFEVGGHTDECGPVELNVRLSNERAEAVRKYLLSQGVPLARLQSRGYGPNQPMIGQKVDCSRLTQQEKDGHPVLSKNRRTEFMLLTRGN
jgi:outer membrane protein OmpA-like peptidoglycan-associated protein